MDRQLGDQDWMPRSSSQPSGSPLRLPVTPPSASLLGASSQTSPAPYHRSAQYSSQHTPHGLSPLHQRQLPPIPIQPYSTLPAVPIQTLLLSTVITLRIQHISNIIYLKLMLPQRLERPPGISDRSMYTVSMTTHVARDWWMQSNISSTLHLLSPRHGHLLPSIPSRTRSYEM